VNRLLVGLALICLWTSSALFAQTESGSVTGLVRDPQGAAVVGADVVATNTETGVANQVKTGDTGAFSFPSLHPSHYKVVVKATGFKEAVLEVDIHVQDRLSKDVTLAMGSSSETIDVSATSGEVSTSAATTTEVERNFIENMPLNGRTFQSLIALTPGNVTAKAYYSGIGQFSINGQRTDANYFSIDGVSANIGITQGSNIYLAAAGAGAAQATSNNGGYNNLVSVDALQEYKIQSSTYEAEYGRSPGAQLSILTRSGTNQWHGVLFEYLRNEVFDSRDYFARLRGLPRPAEKQNDFGGVFSGPLLHNKLFFLFSYEGLRLRVPFTRTDIVPTMAQRTSAIPAVQPLFNAYPLPTREDAATATGFADVTFSNPSVLNATSLRIDYAATPKLNLFIRGDYGPSNGSQRGAFDFYSRSTQSSTISNVDTITAGATYVISSRLVDDLRVNISHAKGATVVVPTNFGGATVPPESFLFESNPNYTTKTSVFGVYLFNGTGYYVGNDATNHQKQFNLVDSVSWLRGQHSFKFGVDYRRLTPTNGYRPWDIFYVATNFENLGQGIIYDAGITTNDASILRPVFTNTSLYAQDTWRATSRLTLTYGVRWDYDPPPTESTGHPFFTVLNLNDPANVALAPKGTPLWQANKHNFTPRLGIAYTVNNTVGKELVVRGGWGIYFGLGNQQGAQGTQGAPYARGRTLFGADCGCPPNDTYTFPISVADAAPIPYTTDPPYNLAFAFDPHLKDPRVYQWNVSAEQALGSSRAIQLAYVGNKGEDLLRRNMLTPAMGGNPDFNYLDVVTNEGYSNYNALQAQFKQRAWRGLQFLASYTWAHAIDNGSSVNLPNPYTNVYKPEWDRGNSDFDVRHQFSAALTYDVPRTHGNSFVGALTSGWALDSLFRANTASPVDITTGAFAFGLVWNSDATNQRPNIVPGQPFYLHGSQYPGGKRINPDAFAAPADLFTQGNLGRNTLRGFGAWQEDFAIRRTFKLTERFSLLFRVEAFNIFNHSNFGDPGAQSDGANHLSSTANFGLSTQVLSNSLGTGGADGGLSSLYQMGAPRSLQFALKLRF
jgi:hypothetical protein